MYTQQAILAIRGVSKGGFMGFKPPPLRLVEKKIMIFLFKKISKLKNALVRLWNMDKT